MKIKFKNPYTFEGKTYEEIDLEGINNLTGSDAIEADRYARKLNPGTLGTELTGDYAMFCAARASKLPIEFFYGIPMREAVKVQNKVIGFLYL